MVMDPLKQQKKKIAELARKEELEELKLQRKVEKQRKKWEDQEKKHDDKNSNDKRTTVGKNQEV